MNRMVLVGLAAILGVAVCLGVAGCSQETNDPDEIAKINNQKSNNPDAPPVTTPESVDDPKSMKGRGPGGEGP
jgi:hypothetical protein